MNYLILMGLFFLFSFMQFHLSAVSPVESHSETLPISALISCTTALPGKPRLYHLPPGPIPQDTNPNPERPMYRTRHQLLPTLDSQMTWCASSARPSSLIWPTVWATWWNYTQNRTPKLASAATSVALILSSWRNTCWSTSVVAVSTPISSWHHRELTGL